MNQETITYLTNICIGVIVASLLTYYWRQRRTAGAMAYWVIAAWVMTAADVLFAARASLPEDWGRPLPTLGVTLGHAVLFAGAAQAAGVNQRRRMVAAVVILHAATLGAFVMMGHPSNWRMAINGVIWGGFSFASAWCLRRGSKHYWSSIAAPATAFFAHGIFHGLRAALVITFRVQGWSEAARVLEFVGDLEVSFFMVALFVGLLIAHLQLRHEELASAQAEVQTLSGLLPICAWCKKVRDDDGYWQQVEDYFSRRSQIKFTHGVCLECLDNVKERDGIRS